MGCLVFSGVHSAYRRQSSPGPYCSISFKGIRSEDPGFHSATQEKVSDHTMPYQVLISIFFDLILRFLEQENKIRDLMPHFNC